MAPPLGFLQMPEDYLVEEAQKDLITNEKGQEALEPLANQNGQEAVEPLAPKNGQEAVKPLANENGQEALKPLAAKNGQEAVKPLANENGQEVLKPLAAKNGQEAVKPLANENGQEAEKTVAIKNGQEVTSVTSPGCQQITESNLKEVDLVNLNTMKLSNFIPIYKKVMDLFEGQIPLWAVGGHIMAKMKVPILDHSSPKPSCSCKKLTHEMVARTAWC